MYPTPADVPEPPRTITDPPAEYPPIAYGSPAFYGTPPSRGPSSAKVVAIVLASVIGLAAIAAIAISVLLNHHHDNDTKRSVTLPVTILGHDLQPIDPNIGDDTSELLAGTFPAHGPWLTPIGATYGPVGASEFFVGAAQLTRSLTATQIRAFELPRMTPLSVVTKGPFGGTVKCTSSANDSGAACVSIDSSAIVIIVTIGQSESTTLSITLGAVRAIER